MTSPERDGRVPETIGPYRVESLLGRGGMGEVYSGYDERLDRPVALKRVRPSSNDPASSRARFRREARVVARLSHNAIVQVHDWVEDGDELWIVMERVDGHPLRRTLDQGPLPPDRAARIARHIAAGLAVAHEAGVVHRDLKSENVMLLAEDQVKILDFGLAKLYRVEGDLSEASISASGQILGTVRYLSPEQALGHPVDHRSDLFSLGTLLYEMLTGVSPFKGDNAVETLSRICTLKPPPVDTLAPKVGAPLAQLVDQLLQKDRARRPQETREVVTRLADIGDHPNEPERPATSQDSETLLASEPLDSETVVEDDWTNAELVVVHRRRPMLGRAFAVLAAVLVLAALALWRWQPEPPPTRLYVAVPRTVVEAAADDTQVPDLAADAVHAGLLRGLLGFRDVAAVEPASGAQGLDEPTAVARALGVDEVMGSSLSCTNSLCRVSLKRIDSSDGRLRWSHAFTVDRLNLLKLTTVTGEQLRGGYPEMALRSGVPDLQVDPADWEAFLGLERAYWARDGQQASVETVLADLEDLRRRSPRFVEAPLLAATMARMRFEETRAAGDLDRAFAAVDQARTLAPGDPRVLKVLAQVQFESGRLDEAAATLDEVERIEPGDADLLAQRAELLERRGEAAQALTMMQEAVRRQPSWRNYARLSDMVYRAGDLAAARRALEACL
ncbi:MAG: protein kinase, partial [Acidobacteriota bacterium]